MILLPHVEFLSKIREYYVYQLTAKHKTLFFNKVFSIMMNRDPFIINFDII